MQVNEAEIEEGRGKIRLNLERFFKEVSLLVGKSLIRPDQLLSLLKPGHGLGSHRRILGGRKQEEKQEE